MRKAVLGIAAVVMATALPLMLTEKARGTGVITVFAQNEAGFNASLTSQLIFIDFDNILVGTDITNQTIQGVTFQTSGAPLIVVRGEDTYTPSGFIDAFNPSSNKLFPTSGENVLSPGGVILGPGPNDEIEKDDLELIFDIPISAFGFDHLTQSSDASDYTYIDVFDVSGELLYHNLIPSSNLGGFGSAPGGSDFWGIISNIPNIKRISMSETDNNNIYPDSNTGYDSIRYAVPEPSTLALFGLGIFCLKIRRKCK